MVPLEERKISQQAADDPGARRCCASTRARASACRAAPTSPARRPAAAAAAGGGGGGGGFNRLNILIQGPDIEQLQAYTVQLMDKVRTIPGVVDVDTNFEPTQPELRINVDRARAADLGVNIDTLANNLRTLVGGEEVSEFKDGDDQFKVLLRLDEPFRTTRRRWATCWCRRPAPGETVKVSDVAQLKSDCGPASIDRYNRQRQISVNANLQGVPLGEVLANARVKVDELHLKAGLPGGVRRQRADAGRGVEQLHHRAGAGGHLHLHGAGVAVQQLHPPADDHDVAAAQPAGRPAGADGVRHDASTSTARSA